MTDGRDPELTRLLIQELERHLVALENEDVEQARRAVHALKGSAGLAGEPELASAMQRLERRLREGDGSARAETASLVRHAIKRLSRGEVAVQAAWPQPPDDLVPSALDPMVRAQYIAEIADRLAGIDEALGSRGDPVEAVTTVYRHAHTMKGAASAVGDEPMTWFCHGLEELLKTGTASTEAAVVGLQEVAHWRGVLGALLEDPDGALLALRASAARKSGAPRPSHRPSNRPADEEPRVEDATIRVAAASVDRLLDHLVAISLVRERVAARVERSRVQSRQLRRLRTDLTDALRLIGPPRPWGAPAAALRRVERAAAQLNQLGDELDQVTHDMRSSDQALKDSASDAKKQLSAMRQTPIRGMFARLSTAVEAEARRSGREVSVRLRGADETIDRRLAEQLVEPCLQLARNAVAHGIEPPDTREALGKPRNASITLTAKKSGSRLILSIADDGFGVDIARVRDRAVTAGSVTAGLADAADDNTLLALLFLPGFSTRDSSDLLAGRGIGLDIALASIQRLGGTIRLFSRHGQGFEARVDVPMESGLAGVLWVTAAGAEHALPAAHARAVRRNDAQGEAVPHLAACLEPRPNERAPFAVEFDVGVDAFESLVIGVDEVGVTEEVLIRPLTPLVAAMGPFAGAIVRGDGSLRLALDVFALAPRARALGRVPDGRVSDFPRPRPPTP